MTVDNGYGNLDSCIARNNHLICDTAFIGKEIVTHYVRDHNLVQTAAAAASNGFSSANNYAPTGSGCLTVDAGASESAFFTTDILGTIRPKGLAWDIGAYEYIPYCVTTISAGTGGSITTPASGKDSSICGSTGPIVASSNMGYRFSTWNVISGNITIASPTSASTTFSHNDLANGSISASFTKQQYTLTMAGTGTNSPTNGAHVYDTGTSVSITHTASSGAFWKWLQTVAGQILDTTKASTSLIMRQNITVTAVDTAVTIIPIDSIISVYPSIARIDANSTRAQRTVKIKEHGPNKCTANTVVWFGGQPLNQISYTDSTVTDTLFKYSTMPTGYYRVFMIDPGWSPTNSDTLLNAFRALNPSIIVTHP